MAAYVLAAKWVAKEEEEGNVLAALEQLAGPSAPSPARPDVAAAADSDDPRLLHLRAVLDAAAFEAHGASEHFQQPRRRDPAARESRAHVLRDARRMRVKNLP